MKLIPGQRKPVISKAKAEDIAIKCLYAFSIILLAALLFAGGGK